MSGIPYLKTVLVAAGLLAALIVLDEVVSAINGHYCRSGPLPEGWKITRID